MKGAKIREGAVKKTINNGPTSPRPAPPKSQAPPSRRLDDAITAKRKTLASGELPL